MEDVPFDAETGEVLMIPSAASLKTIGLHPAGAADRGGAAGGEALGDYTFVHTPQSA